MLKQCLVAFAALSIAAGAILQTYRALRSVREHPTARPNILIISVCSLRMDLLKAYGAVDTSVPNIDHFFAESQFVFRQAFNGLGWTNIGNYTRANIDAQTFFLSLYDEVGRERGYHHWRIPAHRGSVADNDFSKDYRLGMSDIEKALRAPREHPFFAVVHAKYLHFPLMDKFNEDSGWDRLLGTGERKLLAEYLVHPEKYPSKLPFLLLVSHEPRLIHAHPKFKNLKDPAKALGLMTNQALLDEWKASPGYAGDLLILQKIYRANAEYLDQILKPFLRLWDDEKLLDNTIVIFAGDHGEMHMERGDFTHGQTLWDEALRVPLAIRFPSGGRQEIVQRPLDFNAFALLMKDILHGARSAPAFALSLQKRLPQVMLLRDCMATQRGLRYQNKYKYFVRVDDGARFLFDLEVDPKEANNIASQNPEIVAQMEALYWRHLDLFTPVDTSPCPPFVGRLDLGQPSNPLSEN